MSTKVVKVMNEICNWLLLVISPGTIALIGLILYDWVISHDGMRWWIVVGVMVDIVLTFGVVSGAIDRVREHQPAALAKNIFLAIWAGGIVCTFCVSEFFANFWWSFNEWPDFWIWRDFWISARMLCVDITGVACLLFLVVIAVWCFMRWRQKKVDKKTKEMSETSSSDC